MKPIFILLLLPTYLFAQSIPKDANVIVVKGVTFAQVCSALLERGYNIDTRDSALLTIRTTPKSYKAVLQTESTFIIYARIKDSTVYLTGTYDGFETSAMPVYNHAGANGKTKKSLPGNAFKLINDFAVSLNKPVSYSKQ